MKQKLYNIFILLLMNFYIIFLYYNYYIDSKKIEYEKPIKVSNLKLEQPEFFLSESPDNHLLEALDYYNVKHKSIVYAQAILETGYFKSRVCKEYNNLFGLYDSTKNDYYKFNHWSESILAYINDVQYKYKPPNDYYKFLKEIKYAEDPNYINKLKDIVSKNEQRRGKERDIKY